MQLLRHATTLLLWLGVLLLCAHAVVRSELARGVDARLPSSLAVVGVALAVGLLLARWARAGRPARWAPLGADRLAWCLLVAALGVDALAHVAPDTTVRVLREGIPPLLGWLYPSLALLTPLLLSRSGAHLDAADQALLLTLGLTASSGAALLLSGPVALVLAGLALLMQWRAGGRLPALGRLTLVAGALVALLVVAGLLAPDPFAARPAVAWILAFAGLGLAIAARPRDADGWWRLLAAPVAAAVVVALCGAVVTAFLAERVGLEPALRTRLFLFRQHPNFLAPFFGFHAVIALGLAFARTRGRALALAACALLAVSTVMTDSRAGLAALVVGLLGTVVLPFVGRYMLHGRRPTTRSGAAVVAVVVALVLAVWQRDALTLGVERIQRTERSWAYRAEAWDNSLQLIAQRPWLGLGPRNFRSVRRFEPGSRFFNEEQPPHPHNVPLYVAQAAGLPALALFGLWMLWLLQDLAGRRTDDDEDDHPSWLEAALVSACVGLLLADLLDVGLALDTVVPAPLFLLTGLCLSRAARPSADTPARRASAAIVAVVAVLVLGMAPARARTLLESARLQALHAGQAGLPMEAQDEARRLAARATAWDPFGREAHELLARWLEVLPDGHVRARQVLQALERRAPDDARTQSALGQLALRAGDHAVAAEHLQRALDGGHGSAFRGADRVALLRALAALGRRDEVVRRLVESVRLDVGVIHELPWQSHAELGAYCLPVAPAVDGRPQPPVTLLEAIDALRERQLAHRAAGREVGRDFWMATYHAYRKADRDDLALAVLDDLEAHAPSVERHTLASERAQIALDAGDLVAARDGFDRAHDLSGRAWYATQVAHVQQLMGEPSAATERLTRRAIGEILDQPTAFRDDLRRRAAVAQQAGRFVEAADLLERVLLFEDDLFVRLELGLGVAEALARGRAFARARAAYEDVFAVLGARAYALDSVSDDLIESLPARAARGLHDVWSELGLDATARRAAADRLVPAHTRFAAPRWARRVLRLENGELGEFLRATEASAVDDDLRLPGRWLRLQALDATGRGAELPAALGSLREELARRLDLDHLRDQLVTLVTDSRDPGVLRAFGLVSTLLDDPRRAAETWAREAALLDDPHGRAHALGRVALAHRVAAHGGPDAEARALLVQAVQLAPHCGLLTSRRDASP